MKGPGETVKRYLDEPPFSSGSKKQQAVMLVSLDDEEEEDEEFARVISPKGNFEAPQYRQEEADRGRRGGEAFTGDTSSLKIEDQDSKVVTILEEVTAENNLDEEEEEVLARLVH